MRTLALLLIAVLAGCAAQAAPRNDSIPQRDGGAERDIKSSPLYPVLLQYDRQIAVLESTLHVGEFEHKDQAFANARRGADSTLRQAAARARTIAAMPSPDVRPLEQNAAVSAPSEAQVRSDITRTYDAQSSQLQTAARADMDRYRGSLLAQQNTALTHYVQMMHARVQQAYDSRRQELYEKETAFAIDLQKADEGRVLPLRAQLATLTMSGQKRHALQAQLHAIQSQERSRILALHAQDRRVLAAFLPPLQSRAQADIARMREQLQTRTQANLAQRESVLQAQTSGGAPLQLGSDARGGQTPVDMRSRLAGLAAAQPAQPQAFSAARADLARELAAVQSSDAQATRETLAEIATLRAQRARLYAQILRTSP
jgi:hypothetical protein